MQTPPSEPRLTVIDQPDRSALQRLVLERDVDGEVLWIDVHGTASTYTMTEMALAGARKRLPRALVENLRTNLQLFRAAMLD